MGWLKKTLHRILGWFKKTDAPLPLVIAVEDPVDIVEDLNNGLGVATTTRVEVSPTLPTPKPPKRKPKKRITPDSTSDLALQFYFRGAILDQLDEYFKYFSRMDLRHRKLLGSIGIHIAEHDRHRDEAIISSNRLTPWFIKTRPSVGAFLFVTDPEKDRLNKEGEEKGSKNYLYPKFMIFEKFAPRMAPAILQPSAGEVYMLTCYWDSIKDKHFKRGYPSTHFISVLPNGRVRPLRMLKTTAKEIRTKHPNKNRRRGETFTIPQRRWDFSGHSKAWAEEHDEDPEEFLTTLFCCAMSEFELLNYSMIQVRAAAKDNTTAIFSISERRTAYFFKDRDITINMKGKTARIFHIVAPHSRVLKSGEVIPIRMHFRGLRRFAWNGYQINITVPERTHYSFTDWNVGYVDKDKVNGDKKLLAADKVTKVWAEHIDKGITLRQALSGYREQKKITRNVDK